MAAPTAIRVEGLAELRAVLRRIDPALNKGVREALRDGSQIVAYEVQRRAPVRSGRLVGSVRAFTSGNRAGVRVNATRASRAYPGGYPYPRRIEYEGSGGNRAGSGPRAFVRPAFDATRDRVVRRFEYVLDDISEIWDAGGL